MARKITVNNHEPLAINERDAFIGGYVPRAIKDALRQEARDNHRTLSQQFNLILSERYERLLKT